MVILYLQNFIMSHLEKLLSTDPVTNKVHTNLNK